VLTEFRDNVENLSVEDPANSNNDLKAILDASRGELQTWASISLSYVENDKWEALFGKLPERYRGSLVTTLGRVAASTAPVRPWLPKD
jgi:hypothetical protein